MVPRDPSCEPCSPTGPGLLGPRGTPVNVDADSIQRLIQSLLRSPPLFANPDPRLAPPYNAEQYTRYGIVVVGPNTATGDAGATLGATALATAESAARFATVSKVTPATVNDYVAVFTEQMNDMRAVRLTHVGFRVHSSQRAIRFKVVVNQQDINLASVQGGGLFEPSDYADLDKPMPIYALAQPLQTIAVLAKNLDINSGYLVETLLLGWSFPTELAGSSDTPRTEIMRQLAPGGRVV